MGQECLVGVKFAAWRYFSRNVSAENKPYPSDHPKCALHQVLGVVPALVHSSCVAEAIVQENMLNFWVLSEASVMIRICPLSCAMY